MSHLLFSKKYERHKLQIRNFPAMQRLDDIADAESYSSDTLILPRPQSAE